MFVVIIFILYLFVCLTFIQLWHFPLLLLLLLSLFLSLSLSFHLFLFILFLFLLFYINNTLQSLNFLPILLKSLPQIHVLSLHSLLFSDRVQFFLLGICRLFLYGMHSSPEFGQFCIKDSFSIFAMAVSWGLATFAAQSAFIF